MITERDLLPAVEGGQVVGMVSARDLLIEEAWRSSGV